MKYLGHIICSDLSDDEDMMRQRRYLYAQGNVLSRSFHMCSINVKNTLFRTFCTPMYTCHLWWNYKAQSFHKLKVAFNNAFRMMHNLPTYCSASEMFTVNRVADCKAVIRNLVHRFMTRLTISKHLLVRSIMSSDLVWSSRIRRHVLGKIIVCPLSRWMIILFISLVLYHTIIGCLWTPTLYDYIVLYCGV